MNQPRDDVEETKTFYSAAFGWHFTDYGADYAAMDDAGLDGGLSRDTPAGTPPLMILKSEDLDATLAAVEEAGAEIVEPIFDFPGGRRFHFRDPAGNVLGVWSE